MMINLVCKMSHQGLVQHFLGALALGALLDGQHAPKNSGSARMQGILGELTCFKSASKKTFNIP